MSTNTNIPNWKVSGDFFDVCKCNMPCPCTFAQSPSYGDCDGVLAYHIKNGHYGQTTLDSLNVLGLTYFKGNIWAGETKASIGLYFDEKANPQQREALQMVFSGKAGGFMAEFAKLVQDVRGIEFAPIKFEVSDDLSSWSAEIPGKVVAKAEALSGPSTTATWGKAITDEVDAMGFKWEWNGRSSKHIPFDWSGP